MNFREFKLWGFHPPKNTLADYSIRSIGGHIIFSPIFVQNPCFIRG